MSSRWPTVQRLGEELQKRLMTLKGLACATVGADVSTWLVSVPLQAAQSEAVALALMAAFKVLETGGQGVLKSRADLGSVVHDSLAAAIAREFVATRPSMILVADNTAWVAPNPVSVSASYVAEKWERADKDYSLRVLAQWRGSKSALFVRSKESDTSRKDMVVFKGVVATVLFSSLGLEGRPEVYEVKPMSRLSEAVAQVTAYSWNYMMADVIWKCANCQACPAHLFRMVSWFQAVSAIDVHLGPLRVQGVTPKQFASWISQVGQLFEGIWKIQTDPTAVDVAPPRECGWRAKARPEPQTELRASVRRAPRRLSHAIQRSFKLFVRRPYLGTSRLRPINGAIRL